MNKNLKLLKTKEDEFWENLLEASLDAKAGKTFKGNLDVLANKTDLLILKKIK